MHRIAIWLLALSPLLHAAGPPPTADGVRVTILGYHDFSETQTQTEMRIDTSKFRTQMQALRDLGLPVISMPDFEAWKRGEKAIDDKSVVITIDDGWKSVYTDAFPVLKEFGYPFHIFLYKNYVDGGGRALTTDMIEEMKKHGATIGSHSVSHPYPATVKKHRREGPDAYDAFLRQEMGESKRFLESKFGDPITTYAYPGGFQTEEMFQVGTEVGYDHFFTVQPAKVRRDHDNYSIPRYIILGTHDSIFELATAFSESTALAGGAASPMIAQTTPFPVEPEPGAFIADRLPLVAADLAAVENLDPETLRMKISGFGEVPATFDQETGRFAWPINRRLRGPTCQVEVTWKDTGGKSPESPLRWTFRLDREAEYVPRTAPLP